MASRTQIVCLCEGEQGSSIDPVFINCLMRSLKPDWVRSWGGSNIVRVVPCGNRNSVIERMPAELRACKAAGGNTTLMVWADCDDDCADGEALKALFRKEAQRLGIRQEDFDRILFIFPKDRLENWIEYLRDGKTNESEEGARVKHTREAADAAKKLAKLCREGRPIDDLPPSLKWSCENWRSLSARMKSS